jgi:hypothetical protein
MRVLWRRAFPLAFLTLTLSLPALVFQDEVFQACADSVHTPRAGSSERKIILDALRVPVQRRVGQRVTFVVNHLRVQNGWAFFEGSARKTNGQTLGEKYLWGETSAILRKSGGRWQVLRWGFATDTSLMEQYKKTYRNAPRAIFP